MIRPQNLLIVRTDRIGDVVLSLPMAETVKKHFPQCRVTFLLKEYTQSLAVNNPFIDGVMLLKEKNGKMLFAENIAEIKKRNFDSCIVVYPTFKISLISYLSGIKKRIGTGYRWYSFLFNNKIYQHRKYAGKHELEFNMSMLGLFGINDEVSRENVRFNLHPAEEDVLKIKKSIKDKVDSGKPVIIVHPGSGGSAIDLPEGKYKEIVEDIFASTDANILITGGEKEKDICGRIAVGRAVNLAGEYNLKELIALISMCDIFISNSTGPIHIAAALDKYTIGFYPNLLACSAKRWGPYSVKSTVFTPDKEKCVECRMEQCGHIECMNTIQINEVVNKIKNIYKSLAK